MHLIITTKLCQSINTFIASTPYDSFTFIFALIVSHNALVAQYIQL